MSVETQNSIVVCGNPKRISADTNDTPADILSDRKLRQLRRNQEVRDPVCLWFESVQPETPRPVPESSVPVIVRSPNTGPAVSTLSPLEQIRGLEDAQVFQSDPCHLSFRPDPV